MICYEIEFYFTQKEFKEKITKVSDKNKQVSD